MKTNRILFGALSACFAFSLLSAQTVRADDKPVTLKRVYKEKEARQYKEETKLNLAGNDIVLTQTRKESVEKVKDSGEVTLKTAFTDGKLVGVESEAPPFPTSYATWDKAGKLLEFRIDPESEEVFTLKIWKLREMLSGIVPPKNVVKENESWETELDNPTAKDKKFKLKTQYQGTEQVDGVSLWKLKQTAEMETDSLGGTTSYEAIYWLDPKDGSLIKAEEKMKDIPTNGDLGKITYTHTLKLIKPEKAEKDAK